MKDFTTIGQDEVIILSSSQLLLLFSKKTVRVNGLKITIDPEVTLDTLQNILALVIINSVQSLS